MRGLSRYHTQLIQLKGAAERGWQTASSRNITCHRHKVPFIRAGSGLAAAKRCELQPTATDSSTTTAKGTAAKALALSNWWAASLLFTCGLASLELPYNILPTSPSSANPPFAQPSRSSDPASSLALPATLGLRSIYYIIYS